jgi:uncharacterized iron-regulated membrane protein
VPPAAPERRVRIGVLAIVGVVGTIFPLVGGSLILALLLDFLVSRLMRARVPA